MLLVNKRNQGAEPGHPFMKCFAASDRASESSVKSRSFYQKLPVFTYADISFTHPANVLAGESIEKSTLSGRVRKCKNGNKRGCSLLAIQVMAFAERSSVAFGSVPPLALMLGAGHLTL